ncbi:DnaJ-like protein DjlA [compost metagenome]
MLWPASVLGGLAGFTLASIPGALLGGLLGRWLDRRLQLHDWHDLRERLSGLSAEQRDARLLLQLLGRVAAADPQPAAAQRRLLTQEAQRLALDPALAREAFARGREDLQLERTLRRLRQRPARIDSVLRACWRMAWAGGRCTPAARALLGVWAELLGRTPAQLAALEAAARGVALAAPAGDAYRQALQLLGVAADTPLAEIRQAYRRLRSRHHPDKLGSADAAQLAQATEMTRQLQEAWALVSARHDQG